MSQDLPGLVADVHERLKKVYPQVRVEEGQWVQDLHSVYGYTPWNFFVSGWKVAEVSIASGGSDVVRAHTDQAKLALEGLPELVKSTSD